MQNITQSMPTRWGDTYFPIEIGEGDGTVRLERLLYCNVWKKRGDREGGLEAIFEVTRLNTGLRGHWRWCFEHEARDVTVDTVDADVPGFEGTIYHDGPYVYLDTHAAENHGVEPVGLEFSHPIYGT
jgi:hypothetical protein